MAEPNEVTLVERAKKKIWVHKTGPTERNQFQLMLLAASAATFPGISAIGFAIFFERTSVIS